MFLCDTFPDLLPVSDKHSCFDGEVNLIVQGVLYIDKVSESIDEVLFRGVKDNIICTSLRFLTQFVNIVFYDAAVLLDSALS